MDNNDLILLLGEMKSDIKTILKSQTELIGRQEIHEKKDDDRFASLNRYAASIAIVASGITYGVQYLYHKLTGKV